MTIYHIIDRRNGEQFSSEQPDTTSASENAAIRESGFGRGAVVEMVEEVPDRGTPSCVAIIPRST